MAKELTLATATNSVVIKATSAPSANTKVKVFPFTKEGEKIVIDQFAPAELIKILNEENMNFMHEGTFYSFVNYKKNDKDSKKIEKIQKAVAQLPIPKSGLYQVDLMIDGFNVSLKHLSAQVEVGLTKKWSAKSKSDERAVVELTIVGASIKEEDLQKGRTLAKAMLCAMTLVEMPSNYLTPKVFYQMACEVVKEYSSRPDAKPVTVDAIVGSNLQIAKYGSMYAVSKGSVEEAHLITLTYNGGAEGEKPLVLVGKGLTFDSGGISIKPSRGMGRMKGDMAGAATVLATFLYAMFTGSKQNIVAILACAENMPDGSALKPGDIITAYNGKTIEVEDTDAEGRLVLADALCHAQKYNGHTTIDFATLTGACITALGHIHTGLFTEDDELSAKLVSLGRKSGDTVWPLPMGDEYNHFLKSDVADLNNLCIGQGAGATNGAIFLKEFAPETGWVHMDIAGTSEIKSATGRPVPLMTDFVDSLDIK